MALGTEVVDLVGLNLLDDPNQICAISEVAVMQYKPLISFVRILVEMIDPCGVKLLVRLLIP